ncbi:MAG: hypothetical protein M1831_006033 [Alyxoria varia]|nr:MAG: hypothetical protein M1831_006033 [Alyxoria varia]
MRAIKTSAPGSATVNPSTPEPSLTPKPNFLLVRVKAIALNPTDWKHVDRCPAPNLTVGCDFAGEILEVGPGVTKNLKKGDRVAGFTHGCKKGDEEAGCFAEVARPKGDTAMKVPEGVTDLQACTVGVGIATVAQGMYLSLEAPLPEEAAGLGLRGAGDDVGGPKKGDPILVYGGSTATGLWALQFARLSGLEPVTTCSPDNFDLVKSYGASAAFSYKDSDCGAQIRANTKNKLRHAFDCITEGSSFQICCDALSSESSETDDSKKPQYSGLLPINYETFPRKDIAARYTMAYSMNGEPKQGKNGEEPGDQREFEFLKGFTGLTEKLWGERKLKSPPELVREGGLEGVLEGLKDLKEGRVRGGKLVYAI